MGTVVTRDWLLRQLNNPVHVGVDIGKINDPTAISVAEIVQVDTGKLRHITPVPAHFDPKTHEWIDAKYAEAVLATEYMIRHIRRLPLNTSYPDVALHIADLLCSPVLAGRNVRVLMDVTGVGRPVFDDLLVEIERRKEARHVQLQPVNFVHGEKYNLSTGALGKAYLVSRLQTLLQGRRVHAPDTAEVKATLEELRVYEIKVDDRGKDTYGAFQVGKHDDLATALALSCLEDPHKMKVRYSNRVY